MQVVGAVGYENNQVKLPTIGNPLILKIIEKCLQRERKNRPTFKEIVNWLDINNREKF